jgi:prepilin peptidase dependent protein B
MNRIILRDCKPKEPRAPSAGFTLVELLVGVAIGVFLLFGVVTVFTNTVRGSADNLRSARLNQELSSAMEMMINDIRRAGYSSGLDNAYFDMVTTDGDAADGVIREAQVNLPSATCVLYSYDENSNGTIDATDRHGFRLVNGVIQTRISGADVTNCDNNADNWQPLTDGGTINVTTLAFATTGSRCKNATTGACWQTTSATEIGFPCSGANGTGSTTGCPTGYVAPTAGDPGDGTPPGDQTVETRQVTITLAGNPAQDQATTKRLVASVKVHNDGYLRRCSGLAGGALGKWYGSADCTSVP